jgi:hypothetical protein
MGFSKFWNAGEFNLARQEAFENLDREISAIRNRTSSTFGAASTARRCGSSRIFGFRSQMIRRRHYDMRYLGH